MGEFNFSDLPEPDLMRSIRLFGEKVIPALRGYEPFDARSAGVFLQFRIPAQGNALRLMTSE